ncbi:zinc finger protein 3-like [Branchiostoma floridae]|uniref:Zinc finger protein 3-like n=1 Tax=Branchiostoma floridae TaxID=7739 RepID=A0A9J7HRB8_BRAFL|nr:zinc finger protein 3-like [Branchiostoma floridae]
MPGQQEFICGLSHEVTIAVLPRLNMEELMFELNRRIQNLDKENSIKDRLVSILRDVMLEEYRQLEKKSEVSSLDETIIPVQNQENVQTACAETMLSETSSTYASQQSPGLDIVIKKERDTSSNLLVYTKEPEFNTEQEQLTLPQQDQICNKPSRGTPAIPMFHTPLMQMNNRDDSRIKEEDFDMLTEDYAGRPCHGELNFDTPTSSRQVLHALDTRNPTTTSQTEKTVEVDAPNEEAHSASCHLPPDYGNIHIRIESYVSHDCQIGQNCSKAPDPDQTEHHADDRDTGLINSGHEQSRQDSSEETLSSPCEPTSEQACENMESLFPANGSQINSKRYECDASFAHSVSKHTQCHRGEKPFMCGECGYRTQYKYHLDEHMRKHTGEKQFKCNKCHYKTSYKSYLVQHMICHSGLKPYKCKECVYRTAYKGDLIKHMRLHTGERPYSCQVCEYKAKDRSNLSNHMKKKHQ